MHEKECPGSCWYDVKVDGGVLVDNQRGFVYFDVVRAFDNTGWAPRQCWIQCEYIFLYIVHCMLLSRREFGRVR